MGTYTVKGTYGSEKTKSKVFVYEQRNGSRWYAVDDSYLCHLTYDDIEDGVDVEALRDVDTFTMSKHTIQSEEDLINAVNS